jgi:hypothetical protein
MSEFERGIGIGEVITVIAAFVSVTVVMTAAVFIIGYFL